jgi:hypothetical protein
MTGITKIFIEISRNSCRDKYISKKYLSTFQEIVAETNIFQKNIYRDFKKYLSKEKN